MLSIWLSFSREPGINNTCYFHGEELMPRSQSLLIKKLLFPQIYSVVVPQQICLGFLMGNVLVGM